MATRAVANVTGLHLARRVRCVSRGRGIAGRRLVCDARVALLSGCHENAVAAHRNAGRTRKRALVTLFEFTAGVAAWVGASLVVALFTHLNNAVAALGRLADACLAGRAGARCVHGETIFGASGATLERPFVALFTLICLHDAVTAVRQLRARAGLTAPTGFRLACGTATLANSGRVTSFTGFNSAISALECSDAFLPGHTLIAGFLGFAVRGTAGATLECALITNFAGVYDAVAALERNDTRQAMRGVVGIDGATVVRLDFADTAAAVAGLRVAVVASLVGLIDDTVAACGWRRTYVCTATGCARRTARPNLEPVVSAGSARRTGSSV